MVEKEPVVPRPGSQPSAQRARSAATSGQSISSRTTGVSSALGPLTRREREVLGLLCLRLTDKEIAAALRISRRTASQHVTHILHKLRVPNRRQAALVALMQDLR